MAKFVDQARIDEATGSDRELQAEIGSDFLRVLRKQLLILNDALEERDAECMLRELHSIKDAALNTGFTEIGAIAVRMEEEIQAGDLKHCRLLLDSLPQAVVRLEEELKPLAAV